MPHPASTGRPGRALQRGVRPRGGRLTRRPRGEPGHVGGTASTPRAGGRLSSSPLSIPTPPRAGDWVALAAREWSAGPRGSTRIAGGGRLAGLARHRDRPAHRASSSPGTSRRAARARRPLYVLLTRHGLLHKAVPGPRRASDAPRPDRGSAAGLSEAHPRCVGLDCVGLRRRSSPPRQRPPGERGERCPSAPGSTPRHEPGSDQIRCRAPLELPTAKRLRIDAREWPPRTVRQ